MNSLEMARMSEMAKYVDAHHRPPKAQEGYEAERHPLLKELIMVWAPCGCYWAGGHGGSFVGPCFNMDCGFAWSEVERALQALQEAEGIGAAPEGQIHVVTPILTAVSATETTSTETIPASGEDATVDQLIEAMQSMISEGGPVDAPVPEVPQDPK